MTDKAIRAAQEQRRLERAADRNLERVFIEHWPAVFRLLARLTGDPDEAQDLALETFWQFHRQPPPADTTANPAGWLYRVAMNRGLNAIRARRRRTRYEEQAGRDSLADEPAEEALDRAQSAEERERVRQVLARMDERQAQLLLLRYSGLDYQELASALGVSPNSIGSLLVRAERAFENKYKEMVSER